MSPKPLTDQVLRRVRDAWDLHSRDLACTPSSRTPQRLLNSLFGIVTTSTTFTTYPTSSSTVSGLLDWRRRITQSDGRPVRVRETSPISPTSANSPISLDTRWVRAIGPRSMPGPARRDMLIIYRQGHKQDRHDRRRQS